MMTETKGNKLVADVHQSFSLLFEGLCVQKLFVEELIQLKDELKLSFKMNQKTSFISEVNFA